MCQIPRRRGPSWCLARGVVCRHRAGPAGARAQRRACKSRARTSSGRRRRPARRGGACVRGRLLHRRRSHRARRSGRTERGKGGGQTIYARLERSVPSGVDRNHAGIQLRDSRVAEEPDRLGVATRVQLAAQRRMQRLEEELRLTIVEEIASRNGAMQKITSFQNALSQRDVSDASVSNKATEVRLNRVEKERKQNLENISQLVLDAKTEAQKQREEKEKQKKVEAEKKLEQEKRDKEIQKQKEKMKEGIPKRKDLTGELFAEKIGIPVEAEEGIV